MLRHRTLFLVVVFFVLIESKYEEKTIRKNTPSFQFILMLEKLRIFILLMQNEIQNEASIFSCGFAFLCRILFYSYETYLCNSRKCILMRICQIDSEFLTFIRLFYRQAETRDTVTAYYDPEPLLAKSYKRAEKFRGLMYGLSFCCLRVWTEWK